MAGGTPAATAGPIFIVGNRRSGTTLLRLMFASHSRIGVPPEGGFIVLLGWIYGAADFREAGVRERFLRDLLAGETASDWQLDADDLRLRFTRRNPASFAEAVDEVYRGYLERVFPGKPCWGDKTTWYLDHLPQIVSYFPDARVVHLIRDGRDVLCSYRGVDHLANNAGRVGLEWANNIRTVRRAARRATFDRYVELRYEDLVRSTASELERVCAALGETYEPAMLDFWRENASRELEPKRHMRWKERTRTPASSDSVGRFRERLSRAELAAFEAVAGDLLLALGYPCVGGAGRLRRLVGRAHLRLFGIYWSLRKGLRSLKARLTGRRPAGP